VASFLALFLGATILMSFASLLDTRVGVSGPASTTLLIMACVVGGWGLVIVLYSTLAMLALLARQRNGELALLRAVGATPAQVGWLMVGESAALAVVASAVAVLPSVFAGRMIVGLLRDAHQVPGDVSARFGGFAVGLGTGVTLLAAVLATAAVARRMTRGSVADALRGPAARVRRSSLPRVVGGVVLLVAGLSCAVLTLTAFSGTDPALMAVAGQGAILCAIGFGLLAPWLLTGAVHGLGLAGRWGVTGWLATINLGERSREMAAVLGPIILFTGIATGVLYMQGTENVATLGAKTDIAATLETLNYVVVGMIALFAAIMVVNTLVAATVERRRELGQLRLAGSTPPQVFGMVGVETAALAALAVLAGTVASVATAVPFSVARTGSAVPNTPITVYLGVVVTACLLTLGSAFAATRHAIRTPAIQAATG
jgi:putative ABC transport system permease protein